MSYFAISDEKNNVRRYELTSHRIIEEGDSVFITFYSSNRFVTYQLRAKNKTTTEISDFLEKALFEVNTKGYTLLISEFFVRYYIYIGYDTKEDGYIGDEFLTIGGCVEKTL